MFIRRLPIWAAALGFATAFLLPLNAQAATKTVNCTGTDSDVVNSRTSVVFSVSDENCVVFNGAPEGVGNVIAAFFNPTGATKVSIEAVANNDLVDGATNEQHDGVTGLGGLQFNAGTAASINDVLSGDYTATITSTIGANKTAVLTINYSVLRLTSANITSASVEITDSTPAASSPPVAPPSLQASVSRSQTTVVSTNIGTRLTSIGNGPTGIGRNTPGVGRTAPGSGRTTPTGGSTTSGPDNQSNNFTAFTMDQQRQTAFRGGNSFPLRDIAMAASFDTSRLAATATDSNNSGTGLPTEQRSALPDLNRPLTLWGHGSFTNVKNTRNEANDDSRYNGDVWGYNAGMDYRLRPDLYVGASVGFSQTELVTDFNQGRYDENSVTFTPYAVFNMTPQIKISGMAGYGISTIDQARNNDAVTSDTESRMWFAALNGSYTLQPSDEIPLDIKASLGLLATHKTVDGYTESDNSQVAKSTTNTRQIKPGLELAYRFDADGTVLQPFVKTMFVYDFTDAVNGDSSAYDLGGGVRIGNGATGLAGTIEGNTQIGRSDYQEYSFSGLLSYGFALDESNAPIAGNLAPFIKTGFDDGNSPKIGTGLTFRGDNDGINLRLAMDQVFGAINNATTADLDMVLKF